MASVNSIKITGLATGMDTDEIVKNMLTGEQNKIDKASQTKQTQQWKQEIYRDVIKDVKGLYDKYFSATSSDFILSSKVFSTMSVSSSNSNVISAAAGAGADKIDYKFKVSQIAEGAKIEGTRNAAEKTTSLENLGIDDSNSMIKINDTEIDLSGVKTVEEAMKKINEGFKDGEVKISYSEMTEQFTIETKKTGSDQKLKLEGEFFEKLGMNVTDEVQGKNSVVTVYDNKNQEIKTITNQSNSFTVDNITYSVNGVSDEIVSMTSKTDTQATVDKVKAFINDYNKMVSNIYDLATQKKNNDYPPLTDSQKEDMDKNEIEKWEEKAKVGILRNDSELRSFMEGIKSAVTGQIGGLGISLSDIGITSDSNYNNQGNIVLDEDKFKKALEENGALVYKAVTTSFEKIKDVTYRYAGSSSGLFVKKAGMEKTSTAVNNLFSEQIRKQEEYIKKLTNKMNEKEEALYAKFAALESSMNKLNSQMNYLTNSLG